MKKFLVLLQTLVITNTLAGLPPTTLKGQNESTKPVTFNVEVPANQAVTTANGTRLIDSNNRDLLADGGYEGSSFASIGLTCTVGTCTRTTTTGEFLPNIGKSALKVALSSQAMNVVHIVNVGSAIYKQGAVGVYYRVPATMTDFQICSYVDGAEQFCIATGKLIKNDTFQYVEIPITFGSISAGIKYKTTNTYTANAFFDEAYTVFGLSTQNLMTDYVYTAKISSAGVISDQNVSGWLTSCSGAAAYTCNFRSGLFNVTPNCFAQHTGNTYTGNTYTVYNTTTSSTAIDFATYASAARQSAPFNLTCIKQGVDYLVSSANVYSAASSDYDWTDYTPTITGAGTVSPASNMCKHRRQGSMLQVQCFFTTGTTTATLFSLTLPSGLNIDTTKIRASNTTSGQGQHIGFSFQNGNAGSTQLIVTATGTATDKIYQGANFTGTAALTPANGSSTFFNSQPTTINFEVPISGWSGSNVIVGSFQGYNYTPNVDRVDSFSVAYGTTNVSTSCTGTPCFIQQIGNLVSSLTRASTGTYTMNLSKTYSNLICSLTPIQNTANNVAIRAAPLACTNCNSISFTTGVQGSANFDTSGTLHCQGQY